jgi:hypothetical protein
VTDLRRTAKREHAHAPMSFLPCGPRNTISRVGRAAVSTSAALGPAAAPAPSATRILALASSATIPPSSDAAVAVLNPSSPNRRNASRRETSPSA